MIAGFEQPTEGEILLRGEPVQGIPAIHRPVNTVFQDYALFPHMSVLQNVQFGLKMAGIRERESRQRALDRKSTRLNSSHVATSYAVFCLKKKIIRYKRYLYYFILI